MKINKLSVIAPLFALLLLCAPKAKAQVNAQLYYDFGDDRKFVTLTLEMFKADKWGSTYFFVDHDFNYDQVDPYATGHKFSHGGTYTEIARSLNFWQESAMKAWSLHVEYNGGITRSYPINTAWLFGVDYFMHSKDFKNTLTLQVLGKHIHKASSDVPMQLTAVWAMNDIFGVKGLNFLGFADFWWENHTTYDDGLTEKDASTVFITEPQLFYNLGRHFGVDNFSVGTEIELSNDFGSVSGFKCRPCLGVRWDF